MKDKLTPEQIEALERGEPYPIDDLVAWCNANKEHYTELEEMYHYKPLGSEYRKVIQVIDLVLNKINELRGTDG